MENQKEGLTLETLPKAFTHLTNEVSEIKRLLLEKSNEQPTETDELLTVQDTAKFLSLSVPTVYTLISRRDVPFMKRSKRVYFSKLELINYLKLGRKKTMAETASEAENYLKKNGGKNA